MGSRYAYDRYTETLDGHSMRQVWESTYMERVNVTIKNQYLERMEISSGAA